MSLYESNNVSTRANDTELLYNLGNLTRSFARLNTLEDADFSRGYMQVILLTTFLLMLLER